jgi:hypothetical protein
VADELDEITEKFTADTAEYEEWLESAAMSAQEFADANAEAKAAVDGLNDSAEESGGILAFTADEWNRAADEAARIRNEAAEAAAATDELRDSAGEAAGAAEAEAAALGHLRDNAAEAAVAVRKVKEEDEAASRGGLLMWLNGGGGNGGVLGGALDALPEILMWLLLIVPAIEAALVEGAGLAAGFVAAGLGVAAFAALAIPAITAITGAVGDTKAQLDKLPGPIQTAVGELKNVEGQFKSMAKAFQPEVVGLIGQALGIVSDHMGILLPLAQAAAPALSGVLAMLSNGLNSQGFKSFIDYMEKLEGPAITAIGHGLGQVAGSIGRFLTVMSQHDVVHAITTAFDILAGTINVLTYMTHRLMTNWDQISDAFRRVRHDVAADAHEVAHIFDDLRHDIANDAHNIASYFDEARSNVHDWASDVAGDVRQAGRDIEGGLGDALSWIKSNWKQALAELVDPVGMAVFQIRTHTHEIAQEFDVMRHDVSATLAGWRHDLSADFDDAMQDVARFTGWLPHAISSAFSSARHSSNASSDSMRHEVASAYDGMRHDLASLADWLPREFARLWDQVLSFADGLPGRMEADGRNIVDGLIRGIESAAGDIPGIMRGLASDVESYFTDPLKIFSPSRTFFEHGVNTLQGYIDGWKSKEPELLALVRQGAGGVAAGGAGLLGTAGTSGPPSVHVTMPVTLQGTAQLYNEPAFYQYLQNVVQEAVARYSLNNPGTGFGLPGRA